MLTRRCLRRRWHVRPVCCIKTRRGHSLGGSASMTTPRSGASPCPSTLQFRLGTALIAMIAVAVACAGLARPTPLWAGTLLSLALLSLLSNLLILIYRSGPARAFAVGFLIFGG